MPIKSGHFATAQQATDGKLAELLRRWRKEGQSLNAISRRLYAEHGISVSVQTVANWLDALGITKPAKKAS